MTCLWLIFGVLAILTALCGVFSWARGRDPVLARFLSLSLTSLTVCAFYGMDLEFVRAEDWSALMDVAPTASKVCWMGTVASIAINGVTLLKKGPR